MNDEVELDSLKTGKVPIIWILGGPGSGKGTQCEKIIAKYGFTHLSAGDLLRREVSSGSARGKKLDAIMQRGELVPTEIILEILRDEMVLKLKEGTKGFLIDGYPREKQQGLLFEKTIGFPTLILYFKCSDDTLLRRLRKRAETSGRADDNEETMKARLNTFNNHNNMVLKQYGEKVMLIDAERPPEDIFKDVQKHIDALVKV